MSVLREERLNFNSVGPPLLVDRVLIVAEVARTCGVYSTDCLVWVVHAVAELIL
jgi:hypothetical protein